ncbi:MAG: tetratricopeptide repeat protein [Chitinophagaceae bacterium]
MRKLYISLLLIIIGSNLAAQIDTTVTRLKKELSVASTVEKKLSLLQEIIENEVLINEKEAEQYINEAIFLAEETRDRKKMAGIRIAIARAYLNQTGIQSLLDKSEKYTNEALKITKAGPGLERENIIAMLTMVRIHRNSGRSEKALETNNTAIALANDFGDDSLRVIGYVAMGRNYLLRDEKLNCFKNLLSAFNIADQTRHKDKDWLLVNCYRNLAEFFSSINNYEKSIDYYSKIIEYDRKQKNMVDLMNNTRIMGGIYQSDEKFDIASNYYERSMKMADSLKSFSGKANASLSILNNFFGRHEPQKGLNYLRSHPEVTDFLIRLNLGSALDKGMGSIFLEMNQYDSANYYYSKALPAFEKETNIYSKAQFFIEYGYALRKMGRQKEAISYLQRAKELCEKANNLEGSKSAVSFLDSCYRETGDFKNALFYSSIYTKLKDTLEVLSKEKDIISMEIEAESKRKERKAKEDEEILQRQHNIQYTAIVMGILMLFILLVSFGFLRVPIGWIKALGFISFIFFFEFIILIADQQIHHLTHGEPWKVLGIKVVLIAILLPLHHILEKKVVEIITAQRMKRVVIK